MNKKPKTIIERYCDKCGYKIWIKGEKSYDGVKFCCCKKREKKGCYVCGNKIGLKLYKKPRIKTDGWDVIPKKAWLCENCSKTKIRK